MPVLDYYLSFHLVNTPGAYNPLQQLTYAAVVFLLAPLSIATGVARHRTQPSSG